MSLFILVPALLLIVVLYHTGVKLAKQQGIWKSQLTIAGATMYILEKLSTEIDNCPKTYKAVADLQHKAIKDFSRMVMDVETANDYATLYEALEESRKANHGTTPSI